MPPATDKGQPATDFATRHALAFTFLLFIVWMLPGLVGRDPWKPDEAYGFGLVYHVFLTGDWVVPTLAHEPFVDRPPLFYITAALFARGFGWLMPIHDAARLANAFYLGLALLFIGLTGKELYGGEKAEAGWSGWVSALALIGCVGLVEPGHLMVTDVALLCGWVITLYGLALAQRRPALGGLALGTGVGIAFMSRALLAPAVFSVVCLLLPLLSPQWRTRRYALTIAVALVAALPWLAIWPVALYQRSPELFHEWIWGNTLGRALGMTKLAAPSSPGYYLAVLPWFAFPVWPVALWALWVRRAEFRSSVGLYLPLIVFLVCLLVLSVLPDARELYALPLLPSLCLLAIPGLPLLQRGAASALWWFSLMVFCFFALIGWFYWVALDLSFPAPLHAHLLRLRPAYHPNWQVLKFMLGAAFTASWIWLIPRLPRSAYRPMIAWSGTVAMLWALTAVFFGPWVDSANSYRSMVLAIREALPAHYQCISSRNLAEPQRAMLEYFAGLITYRETEPERKRDCDLLLVQGFRRAIHIPDQTWELIWQGARPGDNNELYRLYRRKATG